MRMTSEDSGTVDASFWSGFEFKRIKFVGVRPGVSIYVEKKMAKATQASVESSETSRKCPNADPGDTKRRMAT